MGNWCDVISSITVDADPFDCTILGGCIWWISGAYHGKLYKSNIETGATIVSYDISGDYPRGLTNDGIYLWHSDRFSREIYKINSTDGSELLNKNHGYQYVGGIVYLNGYIYLIDQLNHKCHKIDISDGSTISSFDVEGNGNEWGLATDGTYLWLTLDNGLGHGRDVQKLELDGTILKECTISDVSWGNLRGIGFDGTHLRVCHVSGNGKRIHKIGEEPTPKAGASGLPIFAKMLL